MHKDIKWIKIAKANFIHISVSTLIFVKYYILIMI